MQVKKFLIIAFMFLPISLHANETIKNAILSQKSTNIINIKNEINNWQDEIETPITFAIKNAPKAIEPLALIKCDLDKKNCDGETPLTLSCKLKKWNIASLLLKLGANANATNKEKYNALFYCTNNTSLFISLHKAGANIYKPANLMHFACTSGNANTVSYLISKKLNFSFFDKFGLTALHYAVVNEKKDIINLLLRKKAKINCLDKNGNTPLLLYAKTKAEQISTTYINYLIKCKANINTKNARSSI